MFYIGLAGIVLFEMLKMYLIMNLPGARDLDSVDMAYFLEAYEWYFRILFLLMIAAGSIGAFSIRGKWLPVAAALAVATVVWFFNFRMTAEYIFEQPETVSFKPRGENKFDEAALVVGVVHNGEAKAYPIRYLAYHHLVRDTVGGKPVMVTYCPLCRTARVNEPVVNGRPDVFRLVGANRRNSIYEDATTHSWWMQATGVAESGPSEGETLPQVESVQVTLRKWFELHPGARVMQPDAASAKRFRSEGDARREAESSLTEADDSPWQDDSWVVGIDVGRASKAYDWNRLKEQHIINDEIGGKPIVLVLGADEQSYVAFERPAAAQYFSLHDNDVLSAGGSSYDFSGRNLARPSRGLGRITASRELWRCWREFHPDTQQDIHTGAGKLDSRPRS